MARFKWDLQQIGKEAWAWNVHDSEADDAENAARTGGIAATEKLAKDSINSAVADMRERAKNPGIQTGEMH